MGRVHKKKIAEYAEAENSKESAVVATENDKRKTTNNRSTNGTPEVDSEDIEGVKNGKNKKTSKRKSTEPDESENEIEEEHTKKARNSGKSKQSKSKNDTSSKEKVEKEVLVDNNEEYEVLKLVDHKIENGVSLFLVRWKGYTKDDDTWEPEDTLSCPDLIEKYNKQQNGAESNSNKTKKGKGGKKGRKVSATEKKADTTTEYEVEKIINYADEKAGRLFLIRWKGYSAKHDTWEPEQNLNCGEIIEKFMEKMRNQENATFKELREEPKKTKRLVNETAPRTIYSNSNSRSSKRNTKKR